MTCPTARRPHLSGDGLLVRIRPRLARLSMAQAIGLCEAAQRFGSGFIDLTRRANLQVRGVSSHADHAGLMAALDRLGLLDANDDRAAVLVVPCWQAGDDSQRLAMQLAERLAELPALPPKFGFAIDAGRAPMLADVPADVRIERGASGGLIVRADGAARGRPVTLSTAVDAALALATRFAATGAKRMRDLDLADDAAAEPPAPGRSLPPPGASIFGPVYGVPFGQIEAAPLLKLLRDSSAVALRLGPNRTLTLEDGTWHDTPDFITAADDPLRRVDACPGAPACRSATVETRPLARRLAATLPASIRSLHVSGCAKGCARSAAADLVLVGRAGGFDRIHHGHASDAPSTPCQR